MSRYKEIADKNPTFKKKDDDQFEASFTVKPDVVVLSLSQLEIKKQFLKAELEAVNKLITEAKKLGIGKKLKNK